LPTHVTYRVLSANALTGQVIAPDQKIEIEVSFRPQTEVIPYGEGTSLGHPARDSFFVNFPPASGIVRGESNKSILEGRGILSKIAVADFTFPDTLLVNIESAVASDYDD